MDSKPYARLAVLAVLALLSCDSPTGQRTGPPAQLVVANNDQQAVAGRELPEPLVVRVLDAGGAPVSGQLVNFRVISGGGSVFAGVGQTNVNGEARERWTLGTITADSQRVEARVVDPGSGAAIVLATFRATALPDEPAELVPLGGPVLYGWPGQPVQDSVRFVVRDRFGNPVPGVAVAFSIVAGGGAVSPATAASDADGQAGAEWTLGSDADAVNQLEARVSTTLSILISASANGAPGMTLTAVSGQNQRGAAGSDLAPFIVETRLADGRPLAGVPVSWHTTAHQLDPAQSTTDAAGRASTTATLGGAVGSFTASATLPDGRTLDFSYAVEPGPPAALEVTPDSAVLYVAGQTLQLYSTATDRFGNVVNVARVWASLDSNIAHVSASGVVTAMTSGITRITATAQAVADTVTVRVAAAADRTELLATTVSAGPDRACAVAADGTGYCWGGDAALAREVGGLRFTSLIVGGSALQPYPQTLRTCGLDLDGHAHCWSGSPHDSPRIDAGTQAFTHIDVGGGFACGVGTDQNVYCWGQGGSGALGQGDRTSSSVPVRVQVPGNPTFGTVAAGVEHACALATTGQIYCWGSNPGGALGVATQVCEYYYLGRSPCEPVAPVLSGTGDLTFTDVSAGLAVTCATATTDSAYCWGSNRWRQLGDAAIGSVSSSQPVRVTYDGIARIDAGEGHVCSLTADGLAVCWGFNPYGSYPVGAGSTESFVPEPTRAQSTLTHTDISSGFILTCATAAPDAVYCWGNGFLGGGTRESTRAPVRVLREVDP